VLSLRVRFQCAVLSHTQSRETCANRPADAGAPLPIPGTRPPHAALDHQRTQPPCDIEGAGILTGETSRTRPQSRCRCSFVKDRRGQLQREDHAASRCACNRAARRFGTLPPREFDTQGVPPPVARGLITQVLLLLAGTGDRLPLGDVFLVTSHLWIVSRHVRAYPHGNPLQVATTTLLATLAVYTVLHELAHHMLHRRWE